MNNSRLKLIRSAVCIVSRKNVAYFKHKESIENLQMLFIRKRFCTNRSDIVISKAEGYKEVGYYSAKKTRYFKYVLMGISAVSFGYGTAELKKYMEKLDYIEKMRERMYYPPVAIPEKIEDLNDMEFRRVVVRGHFIHENEFYIGPTHLRLPNKEVEEIAGKKANYINTTRGSGYLVVTPFKLEDRDLTIMVNRGWVPTSQLKVTNREEGQIKDLVEIVGIVRTTEEKYHPKLANIPRFNYWVVRDLEQMAKKAKSDPVFIDADINSTVKGGPIGGQTKFFIINNHEIYFKRWYFLSLVTFLWSLALKVHLPVRPPL